MRTREFWISATERAVKTSAQSLGATLTASAAGLLDAPWGASLSVAGMAAVLSLLTSIGSAGTTGGGPSATSTEVLAPSRTGTAA